MTQIAGIRTALRRVRSSALLALALGASLPANARAQELADYDYENLAFRGIGLDFGRMWPSNLEAANTVRLRIDLGYLGPGIRIVPTIAYWKADVEDDEITAFERQIDEISENPPGTTQLGGIELSDLTLQVDGHFVWTTPIDLLVYLGAGAGLHVLNGQGESIDDTFIEDLFDSIMPGITVLGGLEYSILDRFRIYVQGDFTIVSDIVSPGVAVGGAVMFPTRIQGEG